MAHEFEPSDTFKIGKFIHHFVFSAIIYALFLNHSKNENEIDLFQCDCIEPRVKINATDSKGIGL